MIEGGLKAPSTTGGKRQRTDSNEYQRGSGSGSGIKFGSGSGHGSGDGSATKRQKFHNRQEQRGGDSYGTHGHFEAAAAAACTKPEAAADTSTGTTRGATMGVATVGSRETTSTIHIAAILEVAGSRGAAHMAAAVAASSGQRGSSQENTSIHTIL